MTNKIKNWLLAITLLLTGLFAFAPNTVMAVDTTGAIQCGINSAASGDCSKQPSTNLNGTIKSIVNILSVLVGIAAVIMIIIGGYRYITSGGQSEKVAAAKNTLLYAIIGLAIAALAQVIVKTVLHNVTK